MSSTSRRKAEKRDYAIPASVSAAAPQWESFLQLLHGVPVKIPAVTTVTALKVPAVLAAVTFLSRTLSTLYLAAYRQTKTGPQLVGGRLQTIIRDAPNPENSGFAARNYFWQSVFTNGRGLQVIVRDDNDQPIELWTVNPANFKVAIDSLGKRLYTDTKAGKVYASRDIIDVPFYLRDDQVTVVSPIKFGEKAIQLALAMNEFGLTFFGSGGVPPLSVEGPVASGAEGNRRAMAEITRSIEEAKASDSPLFRLPPGYSLKEVGYDPQKGQMVDSMRFQIEEIARVYQIPPMFLQDLTRATFNNSEAQDLFLVKHLLTQWTTAYESELNLKLFGQLKNNRFVRHDFDSLLRGDFQTRMEALTSSVQGGIRTPNEARKMADLPAHPDPAADQLFMQGATVPIDEATPLTDTDTATTPENNDQND